MEDNVILKVTPKFNLIYELFMPTGNKIKNSLFGLIFFGIVYILVNFMKLDIKYIEIVNFVLVALMLISVVIFLINVIFQILQYNRMVYKFYNDRIIYEDNFLNQHKKEILYSDIKEIEIKRKIWDRINNRGVIMIYTNAEKRISSGVVLFAIKNTPDVYEKIRNIIYNNK